MLTLGLILVIFSDPAVTIVTLLMMVGLITFNLKALFKNHQFGLLCRSGLLTILTTSWVWGLVWTTTRLNDVVIANGKVVGTGIVNKLLVNANYEYALIEIIGFGLIWYWKRMLWTDIQLWLLAFGMLLINAKWFPWRLLNGSFMNAMQFAWLGMLIAHLLLAWLVTKWLTGQYQATPSQNNSIGVLLVLAGLLFMQGMNQKQLSQVYHSRMTLHRDYPSLATIPQRHHQFGYNFDDASLAMVNNMNTGFEYLPRSTVQQSNWLLTHHQAMVSNLRGQYERYVAVRANSRGLVVRLSAAVDNLKVPFVMYNGFHYQVLVDGHPESFKVGNDQLLTLTDLTSGRHQIEVRPQLDQSIWNWLWLSGLGGLILVVLLKQWFDNHHRIKERDSNDHPQTTDSAKLVPKIAE